MPTHPIARLQSLTDEEKIKLSAVLKRKLLRRAIMFSSVLFVCLAAMICFNKYSSSYKINDNLEVINVFFVIISVLCTRLLISEILEYRKEIRSPNKKVLRARVGGRKDSKIILGNKAFGKEEILLDASDFDSLKSGDEVLLEISAKSNTLFSVKRI